MRRELLPRYDELYVVSDLHLGGFDGEYRGEKRNYRIFRDTEALAWFVRSLAALPGGDGRRVALVLNGDIVDFLADEKAAYFDWRSALEKLQRAMADPEQEEVWRGLRDFVASGRGDLVLVLGNHDLELCLPDPQRHVSAYLTDGQPERRGRVVFAMDGAGFGCRVGDKSVLCLHGNEADPWNAVDYWRLGLIRRALARGSFERNRAILEDGWIPNPGTQLVIDYMNGIKRQYQWIDLLKPEEEASAMVTAAIARMPSVRTFAEVVAKRTENARLLAQGFLGAQPPAPDGPAAELRPPAPVGRPTAAALDDMFETSMAALARGARAVDFVDGAEDGYLMSTREVAAKTARLKIWPNTLRDVLRATLANDKTFDPATKDATFEELDALCGSDIDFLIAGHTHLHRALERDRQPDRFYYNSGTWIRLAQIPEVALADDVFPVVEQRLRHGSMEALEKPIEGRRGSFRLLKSVRTVVRIAATESGTRGTLLTVEGGQNKWETVPVPDTTLPGKGIRP